MTDKNDLITYRPLREADLPFIMDSWTKTLRVNNEFFRQIDRDVYKQIYPEIVGNLIRAYTTTVVCLKEDDDVLIGYICHSPNTLHWVFVKNQWRGLGIMKDIIPSGIEFVSHTTRLFKPIIERYGWRLNPFL
jgi:hypothetical protein